MFVYWIKRTCHNDVYTEGYIGITDNPDRRYKEHQKFSNKNKKLVHAFRKYDDISYVVLKEDTEENCKLLEFELRPDVQIGWNIVPGGDKPPINRGTWVGKKLTDEHKRHVSEGMKLSWSKRERTSKTIKIPKTLKAKRNQTGSANPMFGKTHSEETKRRISESMKGKRNAAK